MRRKKIEEITVNGWVELYKQGVPVIEIGKRSEVSIFTVYKKLEEVGVLKKRTVITIKMIKEWIDLYNSGDVNCAWIARKYGVSRETVVKYLHLYGIKTTKKVFHNVEVI